MVLRPERAFDGLSTRAQVHRLRGAALAAASQYPFEVRTVRLLMHGYNTSFRIDTVDGRRLAMRINVNSHKTEANLAAEVAWLAALASEPAITVPTPQPTRSGELRARVRFESLGRELPVVVMSWLPGKDMGDGSPESYRALGRLTARLHEHTESWQLPAGADFPSLRGALVDVPNRLLDEHPATTADQRAVFAATLDQVQRCYDEVFARKRSRPIHADLHGGNVKWLRGRLAVFDFDDACDGVPVQDLAISAYYLRDAPELEEALLAGYEDIRPLPTFTSEQFEAIVASRNLVLANDALTIANAGFRAVAPTYLANTATKLRAYLDTGVYRHRVPGLAPIDL